MIKEKINIFKTHILKEEFFEAHEALEEAWFPIRKTKNNFCMVLKGFINCAVSLELHKRGIILQSQKIYKVYLKYVTYERIDNTEFPKEFLDLKNFMDKQYEKYITT